VCVTILLREHAAAIERELEGAFLKCASYIIYNTHTHANTHTHTHTQVLRREHAAAIEREFEALVKKFEARKITLLRRLPPPELRLHWHP
jgi:hypothetical protein